MEQITPQLIGTLQEGLNSIRDSELDMIKIVSTPARAKSAKHFLMELYYQFDWMLQAYNGKYLNHSRDDKAVVGESQYETIQNYILDEVQGKFFSPLDPSSFFFLNPLTDVIHDFYVHKTSLLNILGVANVRLSPDPEDVLTVYDINKFIDSLKTMRNNYLEG